MSHPMLKSLNLILQPLLLLPHNLVITLVSLTSAFDLPIEHLVLLPVELLQPLHFLLDSLVPLALILIAHLLKPDHIGQIEHLLLQLPTFDLVQGQHLHLLPILFCLL